MYGYYITQKGADLMAQALLDESKVTITQCAVGDGGNSEEEIDLSRTALNNETYRKSFDIEDSYALAPDDSDTVMIECVIPSEAGELTVSEIGFFDDADNLIAYGVLKEQVLGSDSDGLEYSLDIVSFIELTSEQLSVLKVDLGKANVQAISERVDEFESTVNSTVDEFKSDINNSITTFESTVNQSVQNFEDSVDEFKTDVNGQLDGFRDDIKNLDLGTELRQDLQALEERVNTYHSAPAYLSTSTNFKNKIKSLDGFNSVTSLVFTENSPSEDVTLVDVSKDQDNSVVAWIEGTTTYISAYGKTIYADKSPGALFSNLENITSIDFSNFDTSQVTSMSSMFDHCTNLSNLDLSNFDTSQVTSMSYMFQNCENLTDINLSSFNTSNVTTMYSMFTDCYSLTSLDLSSFNTSKVTNMSYMFRNCRSITYLDLSNFDTSKVTNMNSMFRNMDLVETLDLSNFNISSISDYNNIDEIFAACYVLKIIYAQEWIKQNSIIKNANSMFDSCRELGITSGWGDGAKFKENFGNFTNPSLKRTFEERVEDLEKRVNQYHPLPAVLYDCNYIDSALNSLDGWSSVTSIVFTDKIPSEDKKTEDLSKYRDKSIIAWIEETTAYISGKGAMIQPNNPDCEYLFRNLSSIESIDLTFLDTSNVTNMYCMFSGCSSLVSIDPSQIDTSSATSLAYMFSGCSSLKTMDITMWDTKNVTYIYNIFYNCTNLQEVNMENLNFSAMTNMKSMFENCNNLTSVNLNNLDTSHVKSMEAIFQNCEAIESISLSSFTAESLTNASYMFSYCNNLKSINIKNFNPIIVTNSWYMFNCTALTDIYCDCDWSVTASSSIKSDQIFKYATNLPNWDQYQVNGTYGKPIADGGYFKPSSEAPPDPEKAKSLEERVAELEEALKGGVATSSSFNYLEYVQPCQPNGDPYGDKVTSNPYFQSYYKSGYKDQGCITVKAKNDCYMYSSDIVTNETSRSVTAGETIKLNTDYSSPNNIYNGYYTISFGKDPSEYMVELDTPDVLVVGVATDPG